MNPNNIEITLAEGEVWLTPGGKLEGPGKFMVNKYVAAKFQEKLIGKEADSNCFPELCKNGDAWPVNGYRDLVTIAPGSTVSVTVPAVPGCNPPSQVWFEKCGGCIFVDYDRAVDTSAAINDGTAPELNPTIRYLVDDSGNAVEMISVFNPGAEPVILVLSFYC